jgi:hypothetical protein
MKNLILIFILAFTANLASAQIFIKKSETVQILRLDSIEHGDLIRRDTTKSTGYGKVTLVELGVPQVDTTFEGAIARFDTLTDTWISSNRAAVLGYKEYVALLTQTGTSAPVATVLYNDLGGAVVWTRTLVGTYEGTTDSLFTVNKTIVTIDGGAFINDGGALPLDITPTDIETVLLADPATSIEMDAWTPLIQSGRLVVRIRVYN